MRNHCLTALGFLCIATIFVCCESQSTREESKSKELPLVGSWRLLSGTLIEKGDTTVTDYTKNVSFIKIINDSHFSFVHHDLNKGKDSAAAVFSAGAGRYELNDSSYTEHLEYCTAREWEGHDFTFKIQIRGDTLIQSGIEKIDSLGINRMNIERYVRVKSGM